MPRRWTVLLAVLLTASAAIAADEPAPTALHEKAGIELHQIVTTVSPKNGDLSLCRELTRDSFEVWGRNETVIPIYSVDREGVLPSAPGADAAPAAKRGPVYIAYYIDLPSLGSYPVKQGPDYFAPSEADKSVREMLASDAFRESFKPERGDRLLLALFDGEEVVFETGLTTVEEFTKAFDAIETRTFHPLEHLDDRHRWSSLQQFGIALGGLGEDGSVTKHVILLSSDFPMDASTGEQTISNLASNLERAHVVIHPVDLVWRGRVLPAGILTLSWVAQGELFAHGKTALDAVEKVIGIYDNGCRLIISIRATSEKVSLHLLDKRFTIPPPAPVRPLPPLTTDERFEANYHLRAWGGGLRLDSMFWPVKPLDRRTWRGYILAKLRIEPGETLPQSVYELQAFASLNDFKPPLSLTLADTDVEELRSRGSKLVIFEVTVKAGTRKSLSVVTTESATVGATSRKVFTVPKPPRAGESASWSLIGGEGSLAGTSILIPAFDTTLSEGQSPSFMGFACGMTGATGNIVTSETGDVVAMVALTSQASSSTGCRWLMGAAPATLAPGSYVFNPPNSRDAEGVRFTIEKAVSTDAKEREAS